MSALQYSCEAPAGVLAPFSYVVELSPEHASVALTEELTFSSVKTRSVLCFSKRQTSFYLAVCCVVADSRKYVPKGSRCAFACNQEDVH